MQFLGQLQPLSFNENCYIEAPEVLSESDLEEIVDVWQRKSRRVNV